MARNTLIAMGSALLLVACGGDGSKNEKKDGGSAADSGSALCDPVEVECEDEMIQQLSLHTTVATGQVTTTESSGVFTTVVDARAGGMSQANNHPFVYVKFEDGGAVKVDIDDEAALASQDWDLAARRFVVRLNSGDSGPSCVTAAATTGDFASVSQVPPVFSEEDFYSSSCDYVTDTRFSGFDGPDTLLKGFWEMNSMCVATTGQVFVLHTADGRHLKLVIDAYYATGQDGCNTGGTGGTESGTLTMRWAWL